MVQESPSTRGLVDGDIRTPLRRITGILDSMPTEPRTYGEGEKARTSTQVTLNFRDLEVIETTEPYHYPIFSPQFSQSNRKQSRWGILSESFNEIVDSVLTAEQKDKDNPNFIPPKDRTDIKDCIGKRFGLVMADGEDGRPNLHMLYDGRSDSDKPTATWMVYSVEGFGVAGGQGVTPLNKAMSMLDGKTLADFNAAALADPIVRGDATLLASISMPPSAPTSFSNTMVASGQFTVDENGVYHKIVA